MAADGQEVDRTDYSGLFAVIGITHGYGDQTDTFNVPDYRGRFLRGIAGSSSLDPDKTSRTAMPAGGATGNVVGSVQADELAAHSHTYEGPSGPVSLQAGGSYGGVASASTPTASSSTGGNETRPENAYVLYCIKY